MQQKSSWFSLKTKAGNQYLFDYENKYIGLAPDPLIECMRDPESEVPEDGQEYYIRKAELLRQNGLGYLRETEYVSLKAKTVESDLANLRQLVFEVTDACNLQCTYCGFGTLYQDYDERKHTMMRLEQILPVFNYLDALRESNLNTSFEKPLAISFYGGEPLLNIGFIQDLVAHIKARYARNDLFFFTMTTNAVLLDKYMDFLVENKFHLLISLDGDKEGQSYRIDASGKNSFDTVIKNVDLLQQKHPEYFEQYINFNAVLHNRNSVAGIHEFISQRYNKVPNINEVNSVGIKAEERETFHKLYRNQTESIREAENYDKISRERFFKSGISREALMTLSVYSPFVYRTYNNFFYPDIRPAIRIPTGTCMPFSKKMFITVNGKILPCEKIGHQYALGVVSKAGISLYPEKVAGLYNHWYSHIKNQCIICYRKNACTQCIFQLADFEKRDTICNGYLTKEKYQSRLCSVISFYEGHPETYHHIMTQVAIR